MLIHYALVIFNSYFDITRGYPNRFSHEYVVSRLTFRLRLPRWNHRFQKFCFLYLDLVGGLEHFLVFPYIGHVIIPIDFHTFQMIWNHQPVTLDHALDPSFSFLFWFILMFLTLDPSFDIPWRFTVHPVALWLCTREAVPRGIRWKVMAPSKVRTSVGRAQDQNEWYPLVIYHSYWTWPLK